jgi:hypothetical protein
MSIKYYDGWNEDDFQEVLEVLGDIYNLQYEIENCQRGAYSRCYDKESLVNYIKELSERLKMAAEDVDTYEDEDDEENS